MALLFARVSARGPLDTGTKVATIRENAENILITKMAYRRTKLHFVAIRRLEVDLDFFVEPVDNTDIKDVTPFGIVDDNFGFGRSAQATA